DVQLSQVGRARTVADQQLRGTREQHAGTDVPVEIDHGLPEHPAELAEVRRRRTQRQPGPAGPADRDPHGELPVQVVLAGDRAPADPEVKVGLVLGHSPDALAALDGYLGAHRKVVYVLAHVIVPAEEQRRERRSGPRAVRDADGDAELDVL